MGGGARTLTGKQSRVLVQILRAKMSDLIFLDYDTSQSYSISNSEYAEFTIKIIYMWIVVDKRSSFEPVTRGISINILVFCDLIVQGAAVLFQLVSTADEHNACSVKLL